MHQATFTSLCAHDTGGVQLDATAGAAATGSKRKFCVFWGRNRPSSRKSRWTQGEAGAEAEAGAGAGVGAGVGAGLGAGADMGGEAEAGGGWRSVPREGHGRARGADEQQDVDGEPLSGEKDRSGQSLAAGAAGDDADENMSSTKTISSAGPAVDAKEDAAGCGLADRDCRDDAADGLSQRARTAAAAAQPWEEGVEGQQEPRGQNERRPMVNTVVVNILGASSGSRAMIPTSVKRRQMKTGAWRAAGVGLGLGQGGLECGGAGAAETIAPVEAPINQQPFALSHVRRSLFSLAVPFPAPLHLTCTLFIWSLVEYCDLPRNCTFWFTFATGCAWCAHTREGNTSNGNGRAL